MNAKVKRDREREIGAVTEIRERMRERKVMLRLRESGWRESVERERRERERGGWRREQ